MEDNRICMAVSKRYLNSLEALNKSYFHPMARWKRVPSTMGLEYLRGELKDDLEFMKGYGEETRIFLKAYQKLEEAINHFSKVTSEDLSSALNVSSEIAPGDLIKLLEGGKSSDEEQSNEAPFVSLVKHTYGVLDLGVFYSRDHSLYHGGSGKDNDRLIDLRPKVATVISDLGVCEPEIITDAASGKNPSLENFVSGIQSVIQLFQKDICPFR